MSDVHYEEAVVDQRSARQGSEGPGQVDLRTSAVVEERSHLRSPGRVLGALTGLVLAVVGAMGTVDAGFDTSLTQPVTEVFGLGMSAAVGLGLLALGLLILLSALSEETRPLMGGLGVLAILAGVVAASASTQLQQDVGFTPETGWFLVVCGVVAVIAAMLGSSIRASRRVVREQR